MTMIMTKNNFVVRLQRKLPSHQLSMILLLSLVVVTTVVQSFHIPSTVQHPGIKPISLLSDNDRRKNNKHIIHSPNRMMVSPDQIHDLLITSSFPVTDISHYVSTNTLSNQEITQWIADATAAVAASDDGGWWKAYINVFKSLLTFVHSTVDGPLRSLGIEQTWGVSIFLFTASKFIVCLMPQPHYVKHSDG
jgi:hypothetical protein